MIKWSSNEESKTPHTQVLSLLTLTFVFAVGHHNYVYSLPLCLKEMSNLKIPAPYVYQYFKKGQYVVRTKAGSFKGVSSDTALLQTYNRDVKKVRVGLQK